MGASSSVTTDILSMIRLIEFEDFKSLGTFPRYPDNQDIVLPLSSFTDELYKNSLIVFISHCWLRSFSEAEDWDGRPHPDNVQGSKFRLCVDGIQFVKTNLAPGMQHCYIWLDFGCIDQNINPGGELKMLDKIMQVCDCIFTPIYDSPHWNFTGKITNLREDYASPGWKGEPCSYLNRGWCRAEMFYGANIPLFARESSEKLHHERLKKFDHGLAYHQKEGHRPHIIYGSHEMKRHLEPFIMPPLLNSSFDTYHPEMGHFTNEQDRDIIHTLVETLKPYMQTVEEDGYIGDYDDQGEREGKGKYLYPDGESYEGQWKAGEKHGYGKYIYADGEYYEGDWVKDKYHGKGHIVSLSQEYYIGEFTHGIKDGFGIDYYPTGERYEGYYQQGKKHGTGTYYFADGDIIKGFYQYGKRMQTVSVSTGPIPRYIPIEELLGLKKKALNMK